MAAEEVGAGQELKPERSLREKGIENLLSAGFSPEAAIYFWGFLSKIQTFAFAGITFAILSHLFFEGTYLKMFGLYLVHHFDVLDCILYELLILLPSDVSFFEIFMHMEASLIYLLVGISYILTAMVLEVSGFLIRQALRLPSTLVTAVRYLLVIELNLTSSLGLRGLPLYLEYPMRFYLTFHGLRFFTSTMLSLVGWIFSALDGLATIGLRVAVIRVPQIWRKVSRLLQRTKGLFSRIQQALVQYLSMQRHKYPFYTYSLLHSGNEIRLLRLSGKVWGPQIQGKLVHTQIDKLPSYECISHRWGDSTEQRQIVLNGQTLNVSPSVHNILCQRRAFFWSRLIWVDSVCINQEDPKEKSHQVRKMQTIYAKAARVTVCLGDSPDAHLARRLIRDIYAHLTVFERKEWSNVIGGWYIKRQEENDWNTPPEWLALRKLFRNSWFERCWVIQEVILASKVYVLYGGKYIDWSILLALISAFQNEQSGSIRRFLVKEDSHHMTPTPASLLHAPILEGYRLRYRRNFPLKFHDLLKHSLTFRATQPRDKIFALQGITEAAPYLTIDYEAKLEEVLVNTARYFLSRPEALEVLQHAGIGWTEESQVKNIPSWVVDWSRTRPIEANEMTLDSQFCLGLRNWYRAGGSAAKRTAQIREVGNDTIELDGVHLDYIKLRGKTLPSPPEYGLQNLQEENDRFIIWLREAESIARSLPLQYHTGQSQSEAFWRTCIGDCIGLSRPAESDYEEKFLDWREATIRKYALDHPSSTPGPTPLSENENLLPEEGSFLEARYTLKKPFMEHLQGSYLFSNAIGSFCNGRCFALTAKGYMVVAPPFTKEGDLICLFMGAQVPFVLRPISDSAGEISGGKQCYALVGECYVHGMMDGDGLKQGLDEQTFLLC